MSEDLILEQSCSSCGSMEELYGSTCKHLTLCVNCGKSMAQKRSKCYKCGIPIDRLIREHNVRASFSSDKKYIIGKFGTGLPEFEKNENKWLLRKCLQGCQVADIQQEKVKNEHWLLEHETCRSQYHGQFESPFFPFVRDYLLLREGEEFIIVPAGSSYRFEKLARDRHPTLEEIEEKMKRRTAIRMMKEATFGGGRGRNRPIRDENEVIVLDINEYDEEEKAARKHILGLHKTSGDDDEECLEGSDIDFDDDYDMEKGDDWDYEEPSSEVDETSGGDHWGWGDLLTGIPDASEIKQFEGLSKSGKEMKRLLLQGVNWPNDSDTEDDDSDYNDDEHEAYEGGLNRQEEELKRVNRLSNCGAKDDDCDCEDDEDEHEADEEERGLSMSGEALLLGKSNRLNDSDKEDDSGNYDTEDDIYPEPAPKKEAIKEETFDNSPLKSCTAAGHGTPSTSESSKLRRNGEESKTLDGVTVKKVKIEMK